MKIDSLIKFFGGNREPTNTEKNHPNLECFIEFSLEFNETRTSYSEWVHIWTVQTSPSLVGNHPTISATAKAVVLLCQVELGDDWGPISPEVVTVALMVSRWSLYERRGEVLEKNLIKAWTLFELRRWWESLSTVIGSHRVGHATGWLLLDTVTHSLTLIMK